MDVTMSLGERSAERESGKKNSVVALPCRYLEELDNCSSPGVVSKKAAYFEEVIRSASGEKKLHSGSSLRRSGTGPRSVSRIDESELATLKDTMTVRTLDFSSDSEGSSVEVENRPPEVNKQQPEVVLPEQLLQTKVSGTVEDEFTMLQQEVTKPNETCGDVPEEEIKMVVTGSTHVHQLSEVDGTGVIEEKEGGGLVSTSGSSSDGLIEAQEVLKERKDPDCERHEQVADSSKKVAKSPQQQQKRKVDEVKVKGSTKSAQGPGKVTAQSGRLSTPSTSQVRHRETVRSSASELRVLQKAGSRSLNAVSKSTSFTTPQPFALATEKRRESKVKPTSAQSQIPTRHAPSTCSKDGTRRSVSEFHLKSEERAGKRKEFYLRLEERMSAKEQEKNQMNVKSQEVMDSEYRKLRQSLAFKAKPMPKFYNESSQTKSPEVKKAPTTRAISPKLGRHKCGTNDSATSHIHQHHHVRLCQQQPRAAGTVPLARNRRLSETSRSLSGAGNVLSPAKVGEAGGGKKCSEAVKASSDSAQVVGVVAADEDFLDLKEEDETLLFGASIAEGSCFSDRQS